MISKFKLLSSVIVLAATIFFCAAPAFADSIVLTLDHPIQTGTAGSTLSFTGSVFAPATNGGTVSLDTDAANGPSFDNPPNFDDSGFFSNFFSVDPGQTVSGLLFTITLPTNIAPGTYNSFYEIVGSDSNSSNISTSEQFTINVPTVAATPEPGTWLLLATGIAAIWLFAKYGKAGSEAATRT